MRGNAFANVASSAPYMFLSRSHCTIAVPANATRTGFVPLPRWNALHEMSPPMCGSALKNRKRGVVHAGMCVAAWPHGPALSLRRLLPTQQPQHWSCGGMGRKGTPPLGGCHVPLVLTPWRWGQPPRDRGFGPRAPRGRTHLAVARLCGRLAHGGWWKRQGQSGVYARSTIQIAISIARGYNTHVTASRVGSNPEVARYSVRYTPTIRSTAMARRKQSAR